MGHSEFWLQNRIFAAAGDDVCAEMASRYPVVQWDPGKVITRTGDAADSLYVVLRGTVRLFHETPDDRNITVKLLSAPSIFCENEVLHQIPLLINIASLDEVLLSTIPAAEFRAILERYPSVAVAFAYHATAAFAVATISQKQALTSLEARIATVLLSYADIYGRAHPDGVLVEHQLSQPQIAEMSGAVERSVTRVISAWQKTGLLTKRGRFFVLNCWEDLEMIAHPIRSSLTYRIGMKLSHLYDSPRVVNAELEVVGGIQHLAGQRRRVEGDLLVGRGEQCGLRLPHETVSPNHCRVFRAKTGGRYWVEDLGGVNGTYVNNRSVRLAVLRNDDVIDLGAAKLKVHLVVEQNGPAERDAPDS